MSNLTLKPISFVSGKNYLNKCLSEGNYLSQQILTQPFLMNGELSVILPDNFELPENLDYSKGLDYRFDEVLSFANEKFNSYLTNQENLIVYEDSLAKASDYVVKTTSLNIGMYDEQVYYLLDSSEIKRVNDYSDHALNALGFSAFFTRKSRPFSKTECNILSKSEITFWASNVLAILVGVFDNETFLCWSKK